MRRATGRWSIVLLDEVRRPAAVIVGFESWQAASDHVGKHAIPYGVPAYVAEEYEAEPDPVPGVRSAPSCQHKDCPVHDRS